MQVDGHEVIIVPASFQDALDLKRAIANALREHGLNLGAENIKINEKDPLKSDVKLDAILENVLSVATNPEVIRCLFKCAEHAKFGEQRANIDKDFFDDVKNRAYFYPIMLEVIKENVGPFFVNLGSWFGGLQGILGDTPKQK